MYDCEVGGDVVIVPFLARGTEEIPMAPAIGL